MTKELSWKECLDKEIISKTDPDPVRSDSLKKMAILRFSFWNKKISPKFTALQVEAYYEIIKELVFSHIYKKGYTCKNHLCLIAYLKKFFKNFEYETQKINELRIMRNQITYRGFFVQKDYFERNELEFKHIIKKLEKIINN